MWHRELVCPTETQGQIHECSYCYLQLQFLTPHCSQQVHPHYFQFY